MNVDELLAACHVLIEEWQAGQRCGEYDLDVIDRIVRDLAADVDALEETITETQYSAELISRGRRTGLVLAIDRDVEPDMAIEMQRQLAERFPEVRVAVAPARTSIAFEWDEPEP